MKIIRKKNFAHYFLVVADITRKAHRSCGRGSAAASIVSYALGLSSTPNLWIKNETLCFRASQELDWKNEFKGSATK